MRKREREREIRRAVKGCAVNNRKRIGAPAQLKRASQNSKNEKRKLKKKRASRPAQNRLPSPPQPQPPRAMGKPKRDLAANELANVKQQRHRAAARQLTFGGASIKSFAFAACVCLLAWDDLIVQLASRLRNELLAGDETTSTTTTTIWARQLEGQFLGSAR